MVRYRPPEGSTARARMLRRKPTDAESGSGICFVKIFRIIIFADRRRLRDFIPIFEHCAKLVIEADGGQHGGSGRARTALIETEGYRVLRFWNHEILQNPDGVL